MPAGKTCLRGAMRAAGGQGAERAAQGRRLIRRLPPPAGQRSTPLTPLPPAPSAGTLQQRCFALERAPGDALVHAGH